MIKFIVDDILNWAETYDGPKFHAVFGDSPYGLGKTPDMMEVLSHWLNGDDYEQRGGGFMGKSWDSFVPGPKVWSAIREHCHPGAYLFVYGGTRTADLLGISIRLGGWEKFDEIDWVYGSGFPKSHNIGKAIDKVAGVEREVAGMKRAGFGRHGRTDDEVFLSTCEEEKKQVVITAPATPEAETWEGYGTALKPAHEPILCFRNPLEGTYAKNCLDTGAGALWIEGGRIATNGENCGRPQGTMPHPMDWGNRSVEDSVFRTEGNPAGRWPANLILTHTPECKLVGTKQVQPKEGHRPNPVSVQSDGNIQFNKKEPGFQKISYTDEDGTETIEAWECAPDCPIRMIDEQAGNRPSGYMKPGQPRSTEGGYHGNFPDTATLDGTYGDSGGASRFFKQTHWAYEIAERIEEADPIYYCTKAARAERDAGLQDSEFHSGADLVNRKDGSAGMNSPRAGAGRTSGGRNTHPTVKPIDLNLYLATLLLPPEEYAPRRILIPFCGSGSEAIGAMLAGWEEITGVDFTPEYIGLAALRAKFWKTWHEATGFTDPKELLRVARKDELEKLSRWNSESAEVEQSDWEGLPLLKDL